jgi:hypothetical protein
MEDLIRSKGFYWITLGIELKSLTNIENKTKWDSKNVKACGIIGIYISPYLQFHLQGIDDLAKSQDNIESILCWHRGRPRVQRYNNTPTKP